MNQEPVPNPKGRRLFGKRKRFKKVFGPSLRQVQYSPFRACVSVMGNMDTDSSSKPLDMSWRFFEIFELQKSSKTNNCAATID
jgi:hypothetical protein